MKTDTCVCHIIPPFLMTELIREGLISKENTDEHFRSRRIARIEQLNEDSGLQESFAAAPALLNRNVFDSENGNRLQYKLVRTENDPASPDSTVNTAYENAGKVYRFFEQELNYTFPGDGQGRIILNVHYGRNYNNAFWDGRQMVFGDGNGVEFGNFADALDVVGHEISHGIVQYTANLAYQNQPGALNEHFADVFGVTIRQYNQGEHTSPAKANWLIGDSIMTPLQFGDAIRSMKAPGTAYPRDPQPDHMSRYYSGPNDYGGVHINSGIPNKVFYLASVAFGNTLTAARLWFRTLQRLRPAADFGSFKTELLAQSALMETDGTLPAGSSQKVQQALNGVGL